MRCLSALFICCALVGCKPREAKPQLTPLEALRDAITALPIDGDPAALKLPANMRVVVENTGFSLALAAPLDARELARQFAWDKPYAIAGDVHQQSWQLQLFVKPLADAHNQRIATTAPRLGSWAARVALDARPAGELPSLVSGASPAYDLMRYNAKVTSIRFTRSP